MSESIAEVAAAQEALSISKYFDLSSATLYIYDHLISLDSEIELFWRRRAFASALFLLNRYLTLFCMLAQFTIFIIPPPAQQSLPRLKVYDYVYYISVIGQFPVWGAISSIRAFVVCSDLRRSICRWSSAITVFALYTAPCGINAYGRFAPVVPSAEAQKMMCLSVADIIVVVVTWRQMRRQMKLFSTAVRRRYRPSYASVLLRDGTIYFLVLVPFNAVHLIFSLYSILGQSPRYPTSGIPIFTTPITAILISKFLVHLQEIESATGTSSQSAWQTGLLVLQPSVGPRSREHSPEPSTSTPCRRDGTREGSLQGV